MQFFKGVVIWKILTLGVDFFYKLGLACNP